MKPLSTFLTDAIQLRGQPEASDDLKKNQAFVRKIHGKATPNPMGHNFYFQLKKSDDESAIVLVLLNAMNWGVVISEMIVAEGKTGQGYGNHILKMITKEADKDGIKLSLSAVPLAHAGKKIPKGKLKAFYKKHGFKSDGGDTMRREPK